jgi:hypothetical protein
MLLDPRYIRRGLPLLCRDRHCRNAIRRDVDRRDVTAVGDRCICAIFECRRDGLRDCAYLDGRGRGRIADQAAHLTTSPQRGLEPRSESSDDDGRPTRVSLALDAVVCGSGTTGLRTVVQAVTLHGSFRCRATGLCCARSAPKVLRTFRISGRDLAECEFGAASLDCGGTVGLGGPRTRTGRTATWPHFGHNLDAGCAVSVTAANVAEVWTTVRF